MIRLNLLPHRELKKKQLTAQFYTMAIFALIVAVVAAVLVTGFFSLRIDNQTGRNKKLETKIEELKEKSRKIETLKAEKEALLARQAAVEKLQTNRSEVVQLMDQLARLTPEGIALKSIKQTDSSVLLVGTTQSNARVSTFIHNIENSTVLGAPMLQEIKATADGKANEFTLSLSIKRPEPEKTADSSKPKKPS